MLCTDILKKVKKLASIKLWFVPATADLSGLGSYPPMPEPRTPKWTVWQERRQQQAPASSSTAAPGTVPGPHPLQPPLQPGAALSNVTGDRYTSGGHVATGAATTGAQAAVSTASQSKENAREKRAESEQSPRGVELYNSAMPSPVRLTLRPVDVLSFPYEACSLSSYFAGSA
ncbi:hypothetical protein T492DRAFT_1122107 [Pavlovales sp. CCMP2436]|nr:hypothetical protein T492DRAFT_1122107 [Pavlovales sp. CCMP2436]